MRQYVEPGEAAGALGEVAVVRGFGGSIEVCGGDIERLDERFDGIAHENHHFLTSGGDLQHSGSDDGSLPRRILAERVFRRAIRQSGKRSPRAAVDDAGGSKARQSKRPDAFARGIGERDGPGAEEELDAVELRGLHDRVDRVNLLVDQGLAFAGRSIRLMGSVNQIRDLSQMVLNCFDGPERAAQAAGNSPNLVQDVRIILWMGRDRSRFRG